MEFIGGHGGTGCEHQDALFAPGNSWDGPRAPFFGSASRGWGSNSDLFIPSGPHSSGWAALINIFGQINWNFH